MIEILIMDRAFTWTNLRDVLCLAKLDRVLVLADWETKFPLATTSMVRRAITDHSSLFINWHFQYKTIKEIPV